MKKLLSISLAIVLALSLMLTSVSALDLDNKTLFIQFWAQDTATWSWKAANDGSQISVALGETVTIDYTDVSAWITLDTSASINMGLQVLDQTITANGEHSVVKYELSDAVIKSTGYDDLVIPVAGVYEVTHDSVRPDWTTDDSVVGGASEDYTISPSDIGLVAAEQYIDWFENITSMTVTVTYLEYNGEGPAAEEAPVEEDTTEEDTAEEAPVEDTADEAPADDTADEAPADTGLALAVVPAVVALAAVVLSKKR
ncbi:MAG: hypothetical protein IJ424_04860 [Oscillospiraceae bacterium]|nr:hypothetical protein [Oscillospiraceae bacterium]